MLHVCTHTHAIPQGLQPRSSTAGVLINCVRVCSVHLGQQQHCKTGRGRENMQPGRIFMMPLSTKGRRKIKNGFNCEVSPGCLESSARPVEFSYNVLFSVHIFEALEKSGSCRETKKCLFNILYKKVHKNVMLPASGYWSQDLAAVWQQHQQPQQHDTTVTPLKKIIQISHVHTSVKQCHVTLHNLACLSVCSRPSA